MDNKKTIQLSFPVEYKNSNGEEDVLFDLVMERPKLKHLKLLPKEIFSGEKMDASVLMPIIPELIAGLSGLPIEVINEIDFQDLVPIAKEISDFLGGTQEIPGSK